MQIEKFTVSRDPVWYHAWPDVALAPDGTLICDPEFDKRKNKS